MDPIGLVSIPETNSSHMKMARTQKETIVFQPSIFRGYVSFREGNYPKQYLMISEAS